MGQMKTRRHSSNEIKISNRRMMMTRKFKRCIQHSLTHVIQPPTAKQTPELPNRAKQ